MITPRRTRLVRVPDLHAFRRVIRTLDESSRTGKEPVASTVVIVPTRGAALLLRADNPGCCALTRDELYETLRTRLANPPRLLSTFERDALAQAAAAKALRELPPPGLAFRLRPGLVAELLRFYDQLRRQSQSVQRFEELMVEALGGAEGTDRGAERLLTQTTFLAAALREYERATAASGGLDEHALRDLLIATPVEVPLRSVVVTVADWIAEPNGLFVSDFDLLTRVPGLQTIDLVCTENVLGSGYHERLRQWLPGVEEVFDEEVLGGREPRIAPKLLVPPPVAASREERLWFTYRDREEELVAVARRVSAAREGATAAATAVIYKRPLPYLYLAPVTFGSAGIPVQTTDTLPLAGEPVAAAVDLLFDAVESDFNRDSLVALLRSPHFVWAAADAAEPPTSMLRAIAAFDRDLSAARYLGDPSQLEALSPRMTARAQPAFQAALSIAAELEGLRQRAPASVLCGRLAAVLTKNLAPIAGDGRFQTREARGRAAVFDIVRAIGTAHAAYHDLEWTSDDFAAAIRRWIEQATFALDLPSSGVHFVDDQAARYGSFDHATLVGLVENDWPERPRRNIFYPPRLLKALGWASEKDRRRAADAQLVDLLASPSATVAVSVFTLDDEALVARSMQLDDIAHGLSRLAVDHSNEPPLLLEERLMQQPVPVETLPETSRHWAEMRLERSPAEEPAYHGQIGPVPPRMRSVSSLETYLTCPFKFFAQHVLGLADDPEDEEVMDPRRQGRFVHQVFECFFRDWHDAGHRGITGANLPEARALFTTVVDRALEELSGPEASLERTRLLGSSAAAGLGEAVFRMEAERPTPVVERLLEFRLRGEFTIAGRTVSLNGVADRIDLLADGTFRLIDYKLGWPPNKQRALQLPIYGLCAEQMLNQRGRPWQLGEAAYLAFKGPRRVVPLFSAATDRDEVLEKAAQRLLDTLDAIERGDFPPRPIDVYHCETCSFASVCRLDYV